MNYYTTNTLFCTGNSETPGNVCIKQVVPAEAPDFYCDIPTIGSIRRILPLSRAELHEAFRGFFEQRLGSLVLDENVAAIYAYFQQGNMSQIREDICDFILSRCKTVNETVAETVADSSNPSNMFGIVAYNETVADSNSFLSFISPTVLGGMIATALVGLGIYNYQFAKTAQTATSSAQLNKAANNEVVTGESTPAQIRFDPKKRAAALRKS